MKQASLITQQTRLFSNGVFMWSKSVPRLGSKSGNIKQQVQVPKGLPGRIEAYDELNVQKFRVGLRHYAAISKEGKLYTCGNGNWGVLGHGDENDLRFDKPKQVAYFEKKNLKVTDVALGEYHSIALTEDGSVYTWGYGGKKGFFNWMYTQETGALGHGDLEPHFQPKRVNFFKENGLKVKAIQAGNYHSIALADDGNMYTWGRGIYGVLGNGSNQQALTPLLNEEFQFIANENKENGLDFQIKKVDAADDYTAAIISDGSFYSWGKNDRGQLGVGSGIGIDLVESESIPREIDFNQALTGKEAEEPVMITDVATGANTMLVKDSKGRLYKTGLKIDYTPKQVQLAPEFGDKLQIKMLAAGTRHYAFLDSDNNMHCYGKVFKDKPIEEVDGFGFYDGDSLFEGGKVKDLQMKYEVFGALVQDS